MQKFSLASFLSVLLGVILFTGCSKDDDTPAAKIPEIYKYRTIYMDYTTVTMANMANPLGLIYLEYDNQAKITKRWGGQTPINPSTGFGALFLNGMYDEVTYQGNTITITKGDTLKNLDVNPDRKIITTENGKIVSYIREIITSGMPAFDTTYLYYKHETLFRTVTKNRSGILTKDFYFDGNGNLTEIKGIAISRYMAETMYFLNETFSDYDNAGNPLKELGIFDELFYRSLSRNNYRKYTKQQFSPDSSQYSNENRNWNFKYDNESKIKFDE